MQTKLIDLVRIVAYAALIFIFVMLYSAWNKEHPQITTPAQQTSDAIPTVNSQESNYVPTVSANPTDASAAAQVQPVAAKSTQLIHVTTDVLDVQIDPVGGNIVQVKLLKYPESLHSANPFLLLNNEPTTRYIAQSGLLGQNGPDTKAGQATYTSDKTEYALDDQQNLEVKLNWQNAQGLKVTKTFTFVKNSYEINVGYQIQNLGSQPWDGNLYLQLMRTNTPPATKQGLVGFATYFGAAYSTPEKPYTKISFKQMGESNLNQTVTGGWAAMIQHYFVSAWVPDKTTTSQYFSRITNDGLYTVGMLGQKLEVNPGQTVSTDAKFYSGPAIASLLTKVAPGLQLTIDYGWLWFIAVIIFWIMSHLHALIGNWGWSIVLTTLAIKLMFYHLSAKSYRSMSMLKKLQPKINQLKEKFGDDKQKFTQATIDLYRKEKVNPMSGCLPVLIQIPVFIGLYWVLIQSVELRQAPFIFWIQDLSIKDPYYVLPILMGIAMFFSQRLNPPPPDPMQAKVMMFMPVIFTAMFLNFPAGLMLYWFVNNTLSFLQQWYIMKTINKPEPAKKGKK